jgi:hypothetical protein
MGIYAPLIDNTYFTNELTVGQLSQQENIDALMEFIRRYEYDFLVQLCGMPLYHALYNGLQGGSVDLRWQKMAYGAAFILDTSKVKTGFKVDALGRVLQIPEDCYQDKQQVYYRGLLKRPNDTTNDELLNSGYGATSPIAKYVYFWWNRANATHTGGAGESIQQTQNGVTVMNSEKMAQIWDAMYKEVQSFYFFLDQFIEYYPEFNLQPNDRFRPGYIYRIGANFL